MNSRLTTYTLLILVAFCIYVGVADSCKNPQRAIPGNTIESLETGHFSIKLKGFDTRENRFSVTYKKEYKGLPSVGLSFIYIMGYKDDTGVDFKLNPSAGAKSFDAVFYINVKAVWVSAHIHYIVSAKPEFIVGTIALEHPKLIDPVKSQKVPITAQIKGDPSEYTAFAQISGLKSEENTFNLELDINNVKLIKNTLTVVFTIKNKLKPIELLQVTYFGYLKTSGIVIQPFATDDYFFNVTTKQEISSPKNDDYFVGGLVGFLGTQIKDSFANIREAAKSGGLRRLLADQNLNIQMVFNSNISEDERRRIYLRIASGGYNAEQLESIKPKFKKVYIEVFSTQGYGQIVNTASLPARFYSTNPTEVQPVVASIVNENICTGYDYCVANNGKLYTINNEIQCVFCGLSKEFSTVTGKCECKDGFVEYGKDCVSAQSYCGSKQSVFTNGGCYYLSKQKTQSTCDQNFQLSIQEKRCKCKVGYGQKIEKGSLTCVPLCTGNTYFENGRCVGCKRFSSWNPVSQKCVCIPNSKTAPNGDCQPCSPFATYDPVKNECFCNSGYKGMGIICRPG